MSTSDIILKIVEFLLILVTGWISNSASTSRTLSRVKRGTPVSLLAHRIHGITALLDKEQKE